MATLHLAAVRMNDARRTVLAILAALVALAALSAALVTSVLLLVGGDVEPVTRGLMWVGDIRWRR